LSVSVFFDGTASALFDGLPGTASGLLWESTRKCGVAGTADGVNGNLGGCDGHRSDAGQTRAAASRLTLTAEIELIGTMQYRAGTTLTLNNFGVFDEVVWIVDRANHITSRTGYITHLSLRTTLPNNETKPLTPTGGFFSAPLSNGG
jgi:hypothetical protein